MRLIQLLKHPQVATVFGVYQIGSCKRPWFLSIIKFLIRNSALPYTHYTALHTLTPTGIEGAKCDTTIEFDASAPSPKINQLKFGQIHFAIWIKMLHYGPLMLLMMMAWCLMGIWECSRRAQQGSGGQCGCGQWKQIKSVGVPNKKVIKVWVYPIKK